MATHGSIGLMGPSSSLSCATAMHPATPRSGCSINVETQTYDLNRHMLCIQLAQDGVAFKRCLLHIKASCEPEWNMH